MGLMITSLSLMQDQNGENEYFVKTNQDGKTTIHVVRTNEDGKITGIHGFLNFLNNVENMLNV